MKSLFDIIESAKDGQKPTYDECYWAMLAFDTLHFFDLITVKDLAFNNKIYKFRKLFGDESFKRNKAAFAKSPKNYVGVKNDPSNFEYQKRRKAHNKIIQKAIQEGDGREET